MASITYDQACCVYPGADKLAVDRLDLDIEDGEFVVLVGPSGSGKSTALRMLAGLEEIDSGAIRIGGDNMVGVAPKDRDIAMVFQNYALYPNKTVGENMGFALKMRGVPAEERKAKVAEAARLLDLTDFLDRKPAKLSGGQRQRVAMGRAIVREPQVFCMDEPLSNLDAKLRVQTRTQIAALQRRLGTTTVYVTHDQVEAMTMGDRVAVLRHGVLQQFSTPADLYDRPVNAFVAGFIGSPAMNLFTAPVNDGAVTIAGSTVDLDDESQALLRGSGLGKVIVGIPARAPGDRRRRHRRRRRAARGTRQRKLHLRTCRRPLHRQSGRRTGDVGRAVVTSRTGQGGRGRAAASGRPCGASVRPRHRRPHCGVTARAEIRACRGLR
jgi:multiple sugar transport system ATP-binding protein